MHSDKILCFYQSFSILIAITFERINVHADGRERGGSVAILYYYIGPRREKKPQESCVD